MAESNQSRIASPPATHVQCVQSTSPFSHSSGGPSSLTSCLADPTLSNAAQGEEKRKKELERRDGSCAAIGNCSSPF